MCFEKLWPPFKMWVDSFGLRAELVNDHVSTPAGLKGCPQSDST